MNTRIYLGAFTKEQYADRATQLLIHFCEANKINMVQKYVEKILGTKLNRPQLNKLLDRSEYGEILLVESVDRLSILPMSDWEKFKSILFDWFICESISILNKLFPCFCGNFFCIIFYQISMRQNDTIKIPTKYFSQ